MALYSRFRFMMTISKRRSHANINLISHFPQQITWGKFKCVCICVCVCCLTILWNGTRALIAGSIECKYWESSITKRDASRFISGSKYVCLVERSPCLYINIRNVYIFTKVKTVKSLRYVYAMVGDWNSFHLNT